jgi:hypothetical protein
MSAWCLSQQQAQLMRSSFSIRMLWHGHCKFALVHDYVALLHCSNKSLLSLHQRAHWRKPEKVGFY